MASIVHVVSFLLLTFMVHLLVNCDGRAVVDVSTSLIIRNNEVENSRQPIDVSENLTARNKAEENFKMIEKKICTTPVPRLCPVENFYDVFAGKFKPHCVELFKCNNDAGCCKEDTEVCAPSQTEVVHLHIAMTNIQGTRIYLMAFENDTRCECKPVRDVKIDWRCDFPFESNQT